MKRLLALLSLAIGCYAQTSVGGSIQQPAAGGSGATSVGLSMPATFCAVTNSPVTTTGTLTCAYATAQTANLIFGTDGSGNVGLMSLAAVQLPNPSATTLGGTRSIAAVSHNFLTSISTSGIPAQAQPAFSDISGTATAAQLPNPTATTLGGTESIAPVSNQWVNSISTSGVPALSQPAFTNISGSVAATQLPNPSASTLGGIQSAAAVSNQWINSISTSGVPALSQPAFTNISGTLAATQLPATCATVTATSAGINTTETAIVSCTIPANTLAAGATYVLRATGTGTTTVANSNTFRVRVGTAGTSADVAVATLTLTAGTTGTNIVFTNEYMFTVRTIGAGGTCIAGGWFSNAASTGLSNNGTGFSMVQPSATQTIDTTVQNILQLSYVSAATTTTATFYTGAIEKLN